MSNMFKTTTSQIWQRSFKKSYRVLQVTSKSKTQKQSVYFLKAVEFCPTFDIQIDITLAIFREKLQNHTFQKAHRSLSKHANIISIRPPITYNCSLKIWKICGFFGDSFSKKILLTFEIFNESNIWAKVYHTGKSEV